MIHAAIPACVRACLFQVALLLLPVAASGSDAPKLLHPHPEQELDAPSWVSASWAIRADGTVRDAESIGTLLAYNLRRHLNGDLGNMWSSPKGTKSGEPPTADTPPAELGCELGPDEAEALQQGVSPPHRRAWSPGDFRGWTAASDAVVLGTIRKIEPGFDHTGVPNTLLVLGDVEHLYPSRRYSNLVKYVILPSARFLAGGRTFCAPRRQHIEYWPEVGNRLLIAADLPADRDRLAMTVMSMSRVVRVLQSGKLITHGLSDTLPVSFAEDFPATLHEARTRAWNVWADGFVDVADSVGHRDFTRLWRDARSQADEAIQAGCHVLGAFPANDGWTLQYRCLADHDTKNVQ